MAGQRTQVWKVLGCVYRGRSMMSSVSVCPEESQKTIQNTKSQESNQTILKYLICARYYKCYERCEQEFQISFTDETMKCMENQALHAEGNFPHKG